MDLQGFLENVLDDFAHAISIDLISHIDQKVHTTKLERREKALSYIIESLTGDMSGSGDYTNGFFPGVAWCDQMLALVVTCRDACRSVEARTGFERAEKRIRWALDHPKESMRVSVHTCVGCGEEIPPNGGNHECTNARANIRNAAMTRDDTVQ